MRRIVALSFVCLLVGCGGGDDTTADDTGDDAVGDDAVGDDSAGDDSAGDDTYSLTFGPVSVEPGVEDTRCVTLRLGNTGPIKINRFHNTLSTVSHHFIVYRANSATEEITTPEPCNPFAGTLDPSVASPLMITQRSDETLELPAGVAYSFAADQFIRLEMHFINAGDVTADATATAEFTVLPEAEFENEAEFLFIGSPDIDLSLDPGQSETLQAYFAVPEALDGINFFALTGHTHQLGTDMNVSTAASSDAPRTEIYNPTPFSWSEPETKMIDFTVPSGGGFDFECTWTNDGSDAVDVGFGESANDEMCFFWAYYYPSRGARVCIHTEQAADFGITDLCCPTENGGIEQTICNIVANGGF